MLVPSLMTRSPVTPRDPSRLAGPNLLLLEKLLTCRGSPFSFNNLTDGRYVSVISTLSRKYFYGK